MRAPRAFVSISAMKLTDPWFWVSNSDASVAERIRARRPRWSGAAPDHRTADHPDAERDERVPKRRGGAALG